MDDRSINTDSQGGLRFVNHTYQGRDFAISVRQFYIDQMPTFHWQLLTSMLAQGGTFVLSYEKANERCVITIGEGGFWNRTEINAQIYPTGPVQPTKKASRPGA